MGINEALREACNQWRSELSERILRSLQVQKKVVIIALSRKMPRVFGLIKKELLSSDDFFLSLLEQCEVTTEHAIPLVLNENNPQDVIILDDIVNTGETVQAVVNDVCQFFHKFPSVISLFKAETAKNIENVADCAYGIEYPLDRLLGRFEDISKMILENSLPIDMEYPILCLNTPSASGRELYLRLPEMMKKAFPQCIQYQVRHSSSDNYVVVLEEETHKLYNNDFAKLRFYMDNETMKVVSFSPNVLAEYNLRQKNLFENPLYNRLWEKVWSKVYHKELDTEECQAQSSRAYRTLIVWANYLYSLSSFLRNRKYLFVESDVEFKVELKDLTLILGENMAEEVLPDINTIIQDGEVSPSTKEFLEVPVCLIDDRISKAYAYKKYTIADNAHSVDAALHDIFKMAGNLLKSPELHTADLNIVTPIQESFSSLIESVKTVPTDSVNVSEAVYRWIDTEIDEGRVVPRYERVKDKAGNTYWKRYFKYGSLAIETR